MSSSRPRCPACQRPLSHCLCHLLPSLDSRHRLLILQHASESGHALNTARLAALGLRNAEMWVGERFEGLAQALALPGYRPVLLFPGESARVLPDAVESDGEPLQLVVPDGTWRKARKLLYLNPELMALERVCLPAGLESRYRLRKAPGAGALSTVEAIVEALNRLEGAGRFDPLLAPFEALIEGQIAAMGEDVYRRNYPA